MAVDVLDDSKLGRGACMRRMRPTFDPALPVSRYVSALACFAGAAVS